MTGLLKRYWEMITREVAPVVDVIRTDDDIDFLTSAFIRIKAFTDVLTHLNDRIARLAATDVNAANLKYHRELIGKVLKVQPIIAEPWLEDRVRAFVAENASLIKTLPTEAAANIEQMIYREKQRGLSPKALRGKIVEEYHVTEGRARVIARDQVNKFNAGLTKTRQQNLGITQYTWRTVKDGRVRPDHAKLDGKVFDWDEPPVTVTTGKRAGEKNHPGQDIQCRCFSDPILTFVK